MSKFLCGECIHNSDKGGGCLIPKNLGYVDNCNHYLPKDRPIVQTNEEWIHSLNTEQLAEWMALRLNQGILLALRMKYHCDGVDAVREWLKEKHD